MRNRYVNRECAQCQTKKACSLAPIRQRLADNLDAGHVDGAAVHVHDAARDLPPYPNGYHRVTQFLPLNGDGGSGYQGVALGHVRSSEDLTLEAFSSRVAANLEKINWKILDKNEVTFGSPRLNGVVIRFFFKKKGIDWRSDMYFFRNRNAYMYLQFLCFDERYGQAKALFREICQNAVFAW